MSKEQGILLKNLRESVGFSQRELASKVNVSRTKIFDLEQGKELNEDLLDKISSAIAERLELAYVAGLFDRRSVLDVLKTTPSYRNKYKGNQVVSNHYNVRVEFMSKHKLLTETVHKVFNWGSLTKLKNYSNLDKPYWKFMAWSANGGRVLEKLLPYLKLKRPQALLLLELNEIHNFNRHVKGGRKPLSPEELNKMENIYLKVKELNKAL